MSRALPTVARLAAWRHHLHRMPEIAFTEHKTSAFIAEQLASFGGDIEIRKGLGGGTGIVATIRGAGALAPDAARRAIALRADIDALPIEEEADVPYRSEVPGVAHLCGHDGHTSMLLGAAEALAGPARDSFGGAVHLIFQPAEEAGGGAAVMIEEGLFDSVAADAAEVYGMHNWPVAISRRLRPGQFSARAGPIMASADEFAIDIEGRGGHAAMPHVCVDPVHAGAQLVLALQAIVAREADPLQPVVLSTTLFHAGEAVNAIPGSARLAGTVRAFDADARARALDGIRRVADAVAASTGTRARVDVAEGYPSTVNAAAQTAFAADVAAEIVGEENVLRDLEPPTMGAEDFSYMLQKRPGAYLWLCGDSEYALHHPKYVFDDAVLPLGAAWFVRLAQRALPAV